MLSLQNLSFPSTPPASLPPTSLSSKANALTSQPLVHGDGASKRRRARPSSLLSWIVRAAEKDPQHFDVDPDKAREALQELDQQLQSRAQKRISTPRIKAPDVNLTKGRMTEEISEGVLSYSAVALVLFTILYNIFFETVIKPAIDTPLTAPATTVVAEASKDQTSQEVSIQP